MRGVLCFLREICIFLIFFFVASNFINAQLFFVYTKFISVKVQKIIELRTDGRSDRRTDGRTDGWTDRRTYGHHVSLRVDPKKRDKVKLPEIF